MGMKAIMEYKTIVVVCSNCKDKLEPSFEKYITTGANVTFYQCDCGQTRVTSEMYHRYRDNAILRVKQDQVENAVEVMINLVNVMSNDKSVMFAQEMAKQHRTLQQSFTGLCMEWMKELARMDECNCYDGRNEASVKLGTAIVTQIDNINLPMV